jgi:hypothetical protein
MLGKSIAAVVLLLGAALAAGEKETPKSGEMIGIELTGKLAEEYLRRTGGFPAGEPIPGGLSIQTSALIVQQTAEGKYRISHSMPRHAEKGESPQLITLDVTLNADQITQRIWPKGAKVYADPGQPARGVKPVVTDVEHKSWEVELSDLKGVKLRVWTLTEETGG